MKSKWARCGSVDCIDLAQDMAHWRALVNVIPNTSGETLDQPIILHKSQLNFVNENREIYLILL